MDRHSIKRPSAPRSASFPTVADLRARNKSYETVNWVIGLCAGSGALTRIERTQEERYVELPLLIWSIFEKASSRDMVSELENIPKPQKHIRRALRLNSRHINYADDCDRIFQRLSSPDYCSPYTTPVSSAATSTASSARSTYSSTRPTSYSSPEYEALLSYDPSSLIDTSDEQWANLVGGNITGTRESSASYRSPWKKPNFGIEFRYRMTEDQVVDKVKKPVLPGCKSLYGGQWFKLDHAEVLHIPKVSSDLDREGEVLQMRNRQERPDGFDEISETQAFIQDLMNLDFSFDAAITGATKDTQNHQQHFPISDPTSDDGYVTEDESDAEQGMPSWKIRRLEVEAMDLSERRPPAKRSTPQEWIEANRHYNRLRAREDRVERQIILQEEEKERRRAAERCGEVYRPERRIVRPMIRGLHQRQTGNRFAPAKNEAKGQRQHKAFKPTDNDGLRGQQHKDSTSMDSSQTMDKIATDNNKFEVQLQFKRVRPVLIQRQSLISQRRPPPEKARGAPVIFRERETKTRGPVYKNAAVLEAERVAEENAIMNKNAEPLEAERIAAENAEKNKFPARYRTQEVLTNAVVKEMKKASTKRVSFAASPIKHPERFDFVPIPNTEPLPAFDADYMGESSFESFFFSAREGSTEPSSPEPEPKTILPGSFDCAIDSDSEEEWDPNWIVERPARYSQSMEDWNGHLH